MTASVSGGLPPPDHVVTVPFDAVLFDMDGVVTQTATVHAAAWKELFDSVVADPRSRATPDTPFDPDQDYRLYVDGRSRSDGIRAFLASRDIHVPEGSADDSSEAWSVAGFAARKNDLFLATLARDGALVYPGTVALLQRLRAGGVPVGLVSASRNATTLLTEVGLDAAFDVIIDGEVAGELGLPGKPDPAMFLEAAQRLGVAPDRVAVIEDAVSGVRAARNGGFGLVVGIDRTGDREQLEDAGAHLVLDDVSQLDLGESRTDPWMLSYAGFDPAHEGHREVLMSLGNGYMATRGARPERSDDGTHYPGTYLAGIYNRTVSTIHGRDLEEEHLVNVPNWLPVDVRIGDGPWWSTGEIDILRDRSDLDLRRGVLTRRATLASPDGDQLEVTQRRLVSMHNPHLAALETTVTALGFSGIVSIRAGIDARVANTNVHSYVGTGKVHLTEAVFSETDENTVLCDIQTNQSQVRLALAVRTEFDSRDAKPRDPENGNGRYQRQYDLDLAGGESVTMTRTVALTTSRDAAISSPAVAVLEELGRNGGGFDALLEGHEAAWQRLWDRFGVTLDADRQSQLILNLHVFHVLQAISEHTATLDAGVTARGLNGEGYRGHVFWDELFVMPVIGSRLPQVGRALLDYRWQRLDAARAAARAKASKGRCFRGRAGATVEKKRPDGSTTPAPPAGCQTTQAGKDTSGSPLPTTRGNTSRAREIVTGWPRGAQNSSSK